MTENVSTALGLSVFRRPTVRFPMRFVCAGVVFAVVWSVFEPRAMWLRELDIDIVVWLSNLLGLSAVAEPDTTVRFSDGSNVFRYIVDDGCTAMLVMATYSAAVIAYPSTRMSRALGVVGGIVALFALNLLRLVSLAWVGLRAPKSFDAFHMYWWQVFYVAGTGALWFSWAWWTSSARKTLRVSGWAPRWAMTAFLAGGTLVLFAVLGLSGGADVYYRLTHVPIVVVCTFVFGDRITVNEPGPDTALAVYTGEYAVFAAVVALFLASPGVNMRTRARGLVSRGVPGVVASDVARTLWSVVVSPDGGEASGLRGLTSDAGHLFLFTMEIGIVLLLWHAWLEREQEKQERRLARRQRRRSSRRAVKRS